MPDDVPLTTQERQTLAAALRYWRDEMLPHPDIQPFYFEDPHPDPLTESEIETLVGRLLADLGE